MYNATSISYDGVELDAYGAIYCKVDNSSNKDMYVSERNVKIETSGRNWGNKSKNYFYKVNRKPHSFTIELGFEELNDNTAREIAKLFFQEKFLPLIPDDTNRIYYCMPTKSEITYFATGGYISFDMITFDEYVYSNPTTIIKDLTGNVSSTFNITVFGDTSVYPILTIKPLVSGSTLIIKNITNDNKFIKFTTDTNGNQLVANEIITVNCENEIIETDQLTLYRYDNMTTDSDYIELLTGVNNIKVDGSMILTITYANKYWF